MSGQKAKSNHLKWLSDITKENFLWLGIFNDAAASESIANYFAWKWKNLDPGGVPGAPLNSPM